MVSERTSSASASLLHRSPAMKRFLALPLLSLLMLAACGPAMEGEDPSVPASTATHSEALEGAPTGENQATTATSAIVDPGANYLPQDPIPLRGGAAAAGVLPGNPGTQVTAVTGR